MGYHFHGRSRGAASASAAGAPTESSVGFNNSCGTDDGKNDQHLYHMHPPFKGVCSVRTKVICTSDNLDIVYQKQLLLQEKEQEQSSTPPKKIQISINNNTNYCSPSPPPTSSLIPIEKIRPLKDPWSPEHLQEAIDQWKLNDAEIARLKELQWKLRDCDGHFKYDPHIVLRFMFSFYGDNDKAHQHSKEDKVEQMFRNMLKWRKENDIDNLLDTYYPHPLVIKHNPTAVLKDYDRDGDPIYVERGGNTDGLGLLRRFGKEECMKFATWTREVNTRGIWLEEYQQRQGRKVKDVTVIYDLQGLTARNLHPKVIDFFGAVQTLNAGMYPGPIKRIIILRAPTIFRLAWNLVKHFFPASARDKMIFAGKDHAKVLAKYIDLDVLPPCIYEHGKGEPATGFPRHMEGGMLPPIGEEEEALEGDNKVGRGRYVHQSPSPSSKTLQSMDTMDSTFSEVND